MTSWVLWFQSDFNAVADQFNRLVADWFSFSSFKAATAGSRGGSPWSLAGCGRNPAGMHAGFSLLPTRGAHWLVLSPAASPSTRGAHWLVLSSAASLSEPEGALAGFESSAIRLGLKPIDAVAGNCAPSFAPAPRGAGTDPGSPRHRARPPAACPSPREDGSMSSSSTASRTGASRLQKGTPRNAWAIASCPCRR